MHQLVNLFTEIPQYHPSHRAFLADILRPLINTRNVEQNRSIYGSIVDQYMLVDQLEQADWAVLPYNWNYYHQSKQLDTAYHFIRQARGAGKPVLTWVAGDFGARVLDPKVWVFGAAGYKSSAGCKRFGVPVFIRDPLREQGFTDIEPHPKQAKPRIGFCGYARFTPYKVVWFTITTLARNTASALNMTAAELQTLYPPVLMRQRILKILTNSPLVETDFIQHSQYQAGAITPESKQDVRSRFFQNIRDTDYTVCVRGSGNFSARLYETLAMGRVPVLVDTDCLLPYASDPRWKQCCVYVDQDQVDQIAEIVAAFHDPLSNEEFQQIQRQARLFWEERLCLEGFFNHFPEHFERAAGNP